MGVKGLASVFEEVRGGTPEKPYGPVESQLSQRL
jgi:hypothetical protein